MEQEIKGDSMKEIARIADPKNDNDEVCSVCGSTNSILVVQGQSNCNFCGNKVSLCLECVCKMCQETEKILVDIARREILEK